jgi:hypothetical protein
MLKPPLTSSGGGNENLLRQVLPPVGLQQALVVALEGARGLCFVEDARARPDELLVELPLVIAAQPALAIQRLQPPPALVDPVERAQAAAHLSALAEQLHGAQGALGLGRPVRRVVRLVQVMQGQDRGGGLHSHPRPGRGYVRAASEKTNRNHVIHRAKWAQALLQMTDDATRKRKFEAPHEEDDDSTTESESDSSWAPSSVEEEEGEEEVSPPVVSTYRTRSRGPAPPKPEDIDATMDRADEVVNNESDFSSTTSEEEEEEEEESAEEEEEEEEDTEDDGYSDDDSFVTSGDEEEDEDPSEDTPAEEEEDEDPSEDTPAVEEDEGPAAMDDTTPPPVVEIGSAPSTNDSSTVELRTMHTISF